MITLPLKERQIVGVKEKNGKAKSSTIWLWRERSRYRVGQRSLSCQRSRNTFRTRWPVGCCVALARGGDTSSQSLREEAEVISVEEREREREEQHCGEEEVQEEKRKAGADEANCSWLNSVENKVGGKVCE